MHTPQGRTERSPERTGQPADRNDRTAGSGRPEPLDEPAHGWPTEAGQPGEGPAEGSAEQQEGNDAGS